MNNLISGQVNKINSSSNGEVNKITMDLTPNIFEYFMGVNTVGLVVEFFIENSPVIATGRNPRVTANQTFKTDPVSKLKKSVPHYKLSLEVIRDDWDIFSNLEFDACRGIHMVPVSSGDEAEILYRFIEDNELPMCDREVIIPAAIKKEPRRFEDMPLSSQAVLMCKRRDFQVFMCNIESEDAAKEALLNHCGIKSRAELKTNLAAEARWEDLMVKFSQYKAGTQ